MRRISTPIVLCLLLTGLTSHSQICAVSVTPASPTPGFSSTLTVDAFSGFTSTNQSTLGIYDINQNDELTSPTFFYTTAQTEVHFKYHLASTHNSQPSTPSSYTITLLYGSPQQNISCNDTWSAGAITSTGGDYYFTFSGISLPANTNFRIMLTLDNGLKDVAASAFRANANLNPTGAPLPVKFGNVKAIQTTGGVNLLWSNLTETDVVAYSLERSSNGQNFAEISQVTSVKNTGGRVDYQVLDKLPLSGNSYYRIKATEFTGKVVYSDLVRINISWTNTTLTLYPNPATGDKIGLQIDNLPTGSYIVRIYNNSGVAVSSQMLEHRGGSISQTITLNNLTQGLYTLEIKGAVQMQKQFVVR